MSEEKEITECEFYAQELLNDHFLKIFNKTPEQYRSGIITALLQEFNKEGNK